MKVLWCVCGGEYLLGEAVSALEVLKDVTVVFSAAAEEVTSIYGLKERIEAAAGEVVYESRHGRCAPIVMRLASFDKVVVAPCTANTAGKIVNGIADSLVTNVVSQALKTGVPVIVLPTDAKKAVTGKTVSGRDVRLRCRNVDLENVRKLAKEVKVVKTPEELRKAL